MDQVEGPLHVVEAPVVAAADPFDPESRTAELPRGGIPETVIPGDPLVPGPGTRHWAGRVVAVLGRDGARLVPGMALAALPMHFFVGRLDDTVIAAPALFDLAGGFGLLLLPTMWLAYLTVSALPFVICLAAAVGVAVPSAADGVRPGLRQVWAAVAYRLRGLWIWFAAVGLVSGGLSLVAHAAVAVVASTAVLALAGVFGCVVLIERGHGIRRAAHLLGRGPALGMVAVSGAASGLPLVADEVFGGLAATVVGVVTVQVWAVAALVAYAQGRRSEGPVTSRSLRAELNVPED
ncbi:hypothetical protein [Paractinoplanes atraurantiacus]|uniref:Uncharacterized protein n=1 Tax=Paractinoplanes atraurantiacus TaxID=1036182 RepID=A0A285F0E9_9ACTN|nr:hypothetical protein [Actinoplanes atraurantiacus]SNY04798.1 hypothetical protein SAMN05421748_101320 [Actinoplanes atraurantiacus]